MGDQSQVCHLLFGVSCIFSFDRHVGLFGLHLWGSPEVNSECLAWSLSACLYLKHIVDGGWSLMSHLHNRWRGNMWAGMSNCKYCNQPEINVKLRNKELKD